MEQSVHAVRDKLSAWGNSFKEGMNGFELVMDQAEAYQLGDIRGSVNELFQGKQSQIHLVNRRRDEGSLFDGAAGRSDPILAAAEFARCEVFAAHTFHQ